VTARTFEPHRGHVRATFERFEVQLLRGLCHQLRAVLESGDDGTVSQRLFPSTVIGDDEADRELRGMVHEELRGLRLEGLDALDDLLDRGIPQRGDRLRLELRDDEPQLMLGVLNDLRLAIGATVGDDALEQRPTPLEGPLAERLAVMDHLAWWQEELLAVIDPAAVDRAGPFDDDRPPLNDD
jgi:hypothetical protein